MTEGLDITPERWPDVSRVFADAAALDGAARDAYLNRTCDNDPGLRAAVESLLGAHDNAGSFGDGPVVASSPSNDCQPTARSVRSESSVSRRRPVLVVEGVSHRNSPRWTADGREIYYVSPDDAMMELTLQTVPSLTVSAPRQLFKLSRSATLLEVAGNGRFLLLVHQVRADERPIVVDTAAISSTRR